MKMFQKTQSESLDVIFDKAVVIEDKAVREKALEGGLAELERKLKIIELNSTSKITENEINRMVFWRIKFLLALISNESTVVLSENSTEDLTKVLPEDKKKVHIKKCKEIVEEYSNLSYDFRYLPLDDREELFQDLSNLYQEEGFSSAQYCLFQIALGEESEAFKGLRNLMRDSSYTVDAIINRYPLYLLLANYDQELSKKITSTLLANTIPNTDRNWLANQTWLVSIDEKKYQEKEEFRKSFLKKTTSTELLNRIVEENLIQPFAKVLYRNKEIAFIARVDLFEQALQKCKTQKDKDMLNCYMGLMLLEEQKPKEANKYLKSISIDSEMYSKSRAELGDYYKAHHDYEKAEIYYLQCLGSYGIEKAEIQKLLDGEKISEGDLPEEIEHVKEMLTFTKAEVKKMEAIKGKDNEISVVSESHKRIGWK